MSRRNYLKEEEATQRVFRALPDLPEDLEQWTRELPLRHSKYLMTWREKGIRYGYCTHCEKTSELILGKVYDDDTNGEKKHNEAGYCPACQSPVIFKDRGRGRGKMTDWGKIIVPLRLHDGVLFRFYTVCRDYTDHYKGVKTLYTEEYRCYIAAGERWMWRRERATWRPFSWEFWSISRTYGEYYNKEYYSNNWTMMTKVSWGYSAYIYHGDSIDDILHGTSLQYSQAGAYMDRNGDGSSWCCLQLYLALYSKYPCIEMLCKAGFTKLVDHYVQHAGPRECLNLRGKTPERIFGVNRDDLTALRKANAQRPLDLYDLDKFKILRKLAPGLPGQLIINGTRGMQSYEPESSLKRIYEAAPQLKARQEQIVRYWLGREGYHFASDYTDYISAAAKLELDLTNEKVLFPADFKAVHDRTMARLKIHKNKIYDKNIAERHKDLMAAYHFTASGYTVTAPVNAKEIIKEGEALHHCVGSYAQRHAEGGTTILFLRQADKPKKPFYTMEVTKGGQIQQVRGHRNSSPDEAVKQYLEAWKKEVSRRTKKTNKGKAA
jgi:hypothetical protein